jgi:hypothetical protein
MLVALFLLLAAYTLVGNAYRMASLLAPTHSEAISLMIRTVSSPSGRAEVVAMRALDVQYLLTLDLSRANIQAYLLYRLANAGRQYPYPMGGSYLSAAAIIIPKWIWPGRPPSITKQASDLLLGRGAFERGYHSPWAYGMGGEAMLNFGPFAVPFSFAVLGLATSLSRRWLKSLAPDDARRLLAPLAVMLPVLILHSNAPQIIGVTLKFMATFGLVAYLASVRTTGPSKDAADGGREEEHLPCAYCT